MGRTADAGPETERQVVPLELVPVAFQPAFGPERLCVLAERAFVVVHLPCRLADQRAGGEVVTSDDAAAFGDHALWKDAVSSATD